MSDLVEILALGGALTIVAVVILKGNGTSAAAAPAPTLDVLSTTPDVPPITLNTPSIPPAAQPTLDQWAQAIFNFEGGGPDDRNVRNNNPGNLKFAGQANVIGVDPDGFAIFDSFDSGWTALLNQLGKFVRVYPDFSFTQITAHYLGIDPNNPQVTSQGNPFTYAASVAAALGVTTSATLKNTFGG
jgi:hypothetical protein